MPYRWIRSITIIDVIVISELLEATRRASYIGLIRSEVLKLKAV